MLVWPVNQTKTFSHHAAATKYSYLLLAVVQAMMLPLFVLFVLFWFSPTYDMPLAFNILVTISMLGLTIAALVPVTSGWKERVHNSCASLAYFLNIPVLLLLIIVPTISFPAKVLGLMTIAGVVSVFIVMKSEHLKNYTLRAQLLLFLLFDSTIWIAAYYP